MAQGNFELGNLPAGVQLTGEMVPVQIDENNTIQIDSGIACLLKSIEIGMVVTRADGTKEELPTLRTEFKPETQPSLPA